MAKIIKIDLNLGQKNANPFKTTRKSSTNPFKYQDFEGNTIDVAAFADVFSGANNVNFKGNKHKLITASVIGSITKLRTAITESVANFVNRVKDGITGAWTYAKNTRIEIPGLNGLDSRLHATGEYIYNILNYDIGKGISDSISGIRKNLSDKLSFLNKDVTEIGHDLSASWEELIGKISIGKIGSEKISSEMSVDKLKQLWIKENEIAAKSIELNPASKMEARVA